MAGLDSDCKGTVRWECAVASPRGTNEVERLADLVGPAPRVGDIDVRPFVPGSAVGCVNAERGTLRSGPHHRRRRDGVAADEQFVLAPMPRIASRPGECPMATSPGPRRHPCCYRGLSAPVTVGRQRWPSATSQGIGPLARPRDTGETLQRQCRPTAAPSISAPQLVIGTTMLGHAHASAGDFRAVIHSGIKRPAFCEFPHRLSLGALQALA